MTENESIWAGRVCLFGVMVSIYTANLLAAGLFGVAETLAFSIYLEVRQ